MSTRDQVLACLEQNKGSYISGGELAARIGVGRNSVWKAVKALQEQGYPILSVTGKGYCLDRECDILSAATIAKHICSERIAVEFHEEIDSTNNHAKKLAAGGAPHGTLVVADRQTAGRGRQGRPFYSPAGSGIYFTLILRPQFSLQDLALVTSYTAVAVARGIEQVMKVPTQIKWVNDVFAGGHKVCGILTEAAVQPETGGVDYMVVGIGINVAQPEGGFPDDIKDVAHALSAEPVSADIRARLVARIVDLFMEDFEQLPQAPHLQEYRKRSILDGRTVSVFSGREEFEALVLGVNDDLTLQVRMQDGSERSLSHGEVHIPSSQL